MPNPYLLNIIGLVFEVIGVIYIVLNTFIETGSDKTFQWFIDFMTEKIKVTINPFALFEREAIKVGIFFIVVGLCFQIYANYIQGCDYYIQMWS